MKRIRLRIRGVVQGVFYRASAADEARRLGLVGWVRNHDDGSVEAVAEGTDPELEHFTSWCHCGPPEARVSSVEVLDEPRIDVLAGFQVTR